MHRNARIRAHRRKGVPRFDANGNMKRETLLHQAGKIGWILLWVIGVPIPILLLLFALRGCT